MYEFPIKYFQDNIIINSDNEYWALYKLNTFDYDFRNTDKKFEIRDNLMRFITNIGEEAKILIIPVLAKLDEYFDRLESGLNPKSRIYDVSKNHIKNTKEHIKNSYIHNVNDYDVYFVTRLDKEFGVDEVKETLSKFITEPIDTVNKYLGFSSKITKKEIEKYSRIASEYERQQNRRIRIERATEIDIQWLVKKSFFRGCKKEMNIWKDWQPYYRSKDEKLEEVIEPDLNDMVITLSDGEIDLTEKRVVKIEHDDETSYQTFIALTKVHGINFPGEEFLMYPQQLDFPVEICIDINNVSSKEALKKLEKKKRAIKSQFEHIEKNDDDMPEEVVDARRHLESLESELKRNNSPLTKTTITFCVYSNDREQLEYRAKTLIDSYKEANFKVERPRTDQYKLFFDFIVGTGRYNNNFIHNITPKLIASGMIGATSDLGDNVGCYVGKGGGLEKPVFLNLLHACQLNKPSAGFVVGAQGYGKTFNTNLLVYNHVLHFYAKAFIVDPKGDRKDWVEKLPELREHINVVEFKAGKEDKGKLDPFIIYKDNMDEAGDLALNIICERFDVKSDSETYLALQDAIEKTKKTFKPCMENLVKALRECDKDDRCYDSADLMSRKLENLNKGGLANLLFSDGDVEALSFSKKINIVMIQNLKLPASSAIAKEDYSIDEKLGTVLMLAVANFAKKFSTYNNFVKKIIVMDEAWALAKTKQAEELFERLARTGRSLNLSTLFIGHSVNDITSEGIRNAIRYKFVFNVTNREEAIRTLEFLNMDITEDNISLLSSDERGLANGECLFSDVEGRIGLLRFDTVSDHLIEAFKTTPPEESEV